jgi:glucose-1-phosphate adenylyltransferase
VTLAAIEVPIEDGRRFGIVAVDDADRVTGFLEKPDSPPHMPGQPHLAMASMGIYVFNSDVLVRALEADAAMPESQHDFGRNIIPSLIGSGRTYAYPFYDENKKAAKYWRDIGTIDAYYEANMDLCHVNPEFNLYDPEWPLRTYMPQWPPAKFVFAEEWRRGEAQDSMISHGCIVSGSQIFGSILCPNVRVHSFCTIEQSILMPGVRVGRHARIKRAIIDRDVHIPRGATIGYHPDEDRRRHTVSEDGVVVVASGDEPFIAPIPEEALQREAEADRRG